MFVKSLEELSAEKIISITAGLIHLSKTTNLEVRYHFTFIRTY